MIAGIALMAIGAAGGAVFHAVSSAPEYSTAVCCLIGSGIGLALRIGVAADLLDVFD